MSAGRAALALLLVSAASSAASALPATERSPLEDALLEDAEDRKLDRHTPLDAALIVSGARTEAELSAARERFRAATAPALSAARRRTGATARANALLDAMFGTPGIPPLLRTYTTRATTLLDVLSTGSFNCVSSALAFVLLAQEAELVVRPVILPSHARVALIDGRRRVPVETTTRRGVDPDPSVLREARDRVRAAARTDGVNLYAEPEGTEVDLLALLGVVYTNLSALRAGEGDTLSSASLAGRAEGLVDGPARSLLMRVRASMLSEIALADASRGKASVALGILLEAWRIAPDAGMREIVGHNLAAVGSLVVDTEAPRGEAAALGVSDRLAAVPRARAEVRAYALSVLAHRLQETGNHERAVVHLREASTLPVGEVRRSEVRRNLAFAEMNRLQAVLERDVQAAWRAYRAFEPPDDAEAKAHVRAVGRSIAKYRAETLAQEARCEDLRAAVAEWRELDPAAAPNRLLAGCHGRRANAHAQAKAWAKAADEFRRAMSLDPTDRSLRNATVSTIGNLAVEHARAGRCDLARPLADEVRSLSPGDDRMRWVSERCRR